MSKDVKPVYTAPAEAAAKERFGEFPGKWGPQFSAIVRLWENMWAEFVQFLDYDLEIRRVICSTNAIESLNARYPRAVPAQAEPGRPTTPNVPRLRGRRLRLIAGSHPQHGSPPNRPRTRACHGTMSGFSLQLVRESWNLCASPCGRSDVGPWSPAPDGRADPHGAVSTAASVRSKRPVCPPPRPSHPRGAVVCSVAGKVVGEGPTRGARSHGPFSASTVFA